ncbi:palindromic element RPE5 domain-containing protein [Rickettsia hoogstraalii]|nr:palindromic element RPE5 domain-containing protein [Rickettsia hoogstraalii]MCX4083821.1 palindromic element RPE5 domain-containing protein [Rickettsia hoogstraalii]
MKNLYTKVNFKKSKEYIRRGTERILIREYPRPCRMT